MTRPTSDLTLEELARLVVTLPGWRWMRGMRLRACGDFEVDGACGTYLGLGAQAGDLRIQWDDEKPRGAGHSWHAPQNFRPAPHIGTYALPDLSDAATLGCIRALVTEAAGGPVSVVQLFNPDGSLQGVLVTTRDLRKGTGPTEAHALIALWLEVTRGA